jgi:hypothetical protein
MALSGKNEPDLAQVRVGAPRETVELQLGQPVSSTTRDDGSTVNTYEYQMGNEPSAGRAVAHGVADVLTIGLWEVAGTTYEAVQGETRKVVITYGADGRVKEIGAQ